MTDRPALTQLILLSRDADTPSTCLRVDAGGHLLDRIPLTPGTPLPAATMGMRTVLVVPGIEVLAIWLDLPARNLVQARAAAALLIRDHVAAGHDRLHLSVGAASSAGDPSRLVVAVDRELMRHWLDHAAALGVLPDAVVPDHLMLASPAEGICVAVLADDRWLVRGEVVAGESSHDRRFSFSAEPTLATMLLDSLDLDERALIRIKDAREIEHHFIASASHPPIDLLQGEFARTSGRREDWSAYRRAAALLAVLAFSPLLLIASQALRYELAARQLESQAQALVFDAVPGTGGTDDPRSATHARLLQLQSSDAFARDVEVLFSAVERVEGTHLDSLDYDHESGLRAGLFHATDNDLQSIRGAVAEAGLVLDHTDTRAVDGGLHSAVVMGAGQ